MTRIVACLTIVAALTFASSAQAIVIGFGASEGYVDGDLASQNGWSSSASTLTVSNAATDGIATSTVAPGSVKTMTFGFTDANTGLTVNNASGMAAGQFDITLNSTSGTAMLATIDFSRSGNNYRAMNLDVYQDGTVKIRTDITNAGGNGDVTTTLAGFLTNGVKASISLQIDYTNLKIRLYKNAGLVTLTSSDANGWAPFADVRNQSGLSGVAVGSFYFINRNAPDGSVTFDNIGLQAVPEPASMALQAIGGLAMIRRKR
jgi:hypothetical protein